MIFAPLVQKEDRPIGKADEDKIKYTIDELMELREKCTMLPEKFPLEAFEIINRVAVSPEELPAFEGERRDGGVSNAARCSAGNKQKGHNNNAKSLETSLHRVLKCSFPIPAPVL